MSKRARLYKKQRAALRQRVLDICTGAAGFDVTVEGEFLTGNLLSRILPALKFAFGCEEPGKCNDYLWFPGNLNHYEDVETITDFLFDSGVRA